MFLTIQRIASPCGGFSRLLGDLPTQASGLNLAPESTILTVSNFTQTTPPTLPTCEDVESTLFSRMFL